MLSSRPPPPPAPPPNSRFGRYTLVDRLAVGGMAEIFRAREPRPVGEARLVVIKRMLPAIAAEPGSHAMFQAEADLGAIVAHDNVVDVLGVGEEGGQPFLVLEYVRGLDLWRLSRWLTRTGRNLGIQLSLHVVQEMLAGLDAVHEALDSEGRHIGLVHRDVSPSNVLLSMYGDIKIGDFGIAYAHLKERMPQGAMSSRAKGKLGYLAPEQVTGDQCDRRADVFSAGVIAAELLLGRPLFAGGSELAVLLAIRDAKIEPFLEIAPKLPSGLADVVVKALARDPEDRIATAGLLTQELAPFLKEDPADLRKQLAELVSAGMYVVDDAPHEATPLIEESSLLMEGPDQSTMRPPMPEGRSTVPPAMAASVHEMPTAPPPPMPAEAASALPEPMMYEMRTGKGEEMGPWAYAQVVEALAVGRLRPHDQIRETGGEFREVVGIPELLRHVPSSSLTPTTQRREAPEEPDELVPLAYGGIVNALAYTAVRRDSGLWLCEVGGIRKEVYVKDGVPEFVTSNLAGELLGEYLVTQDIITRGQLDMALAVMPRFEGRLGDTLAGLGLVEPVHLFQHIAGQVREKLLEIFLWSGGQASLYLGVPPPPSAFPLGLDPWRILDEGVGRRIGQGLEDERFSAGKPMIAANPLPAALVLNSMPGALRAVLAMLQEPCTVEELEETMGRGASPADSHARRALVILMHLGAIEWAS